MKPKDKGHKGRYERHKRYLEDNGAEIMMHGDEIYLREYVAEKTQYTLLSAKRGVLLYNWLANHIEELRELAREDLPTPEMQAEPLDPESFAGLLAQLLQQLKELDNNLEEVADECQHRLNPLLRSWLLQLQVLKSLKECKRDHLRIMVRPGTRKAPANRFHEFPFLIKRRKYARGFTRQWQ